MGSAFGIGTNTTKINSGFVRGNQIEIACECWFTRQGRVMPRFIKFQDTEGELQTISEIQVCCFEKKNYAGIPSLEFDCYITYEGIRFPAKLIFFMGECRWVMII